MSFYTRAIQATLLSVTLCLGGCVTNVEQGNPDGWQAIEPPKVPELAALVPESAAAKGYLTMGTNPPFAPFQFKDSSGQIIGLEVDLARAMASVLGLGLEPVDLDFAMILPSVQSGTVDFGGSGFTDTEERQKSFDFVDSLFAGVQWTQQPGAGIDPNNACGLTVAVQRATVSHTDDVIPKSQACEEAGREPIEILSYDTSDTAATAAVLGRADAFSADSPVSAWAVERAEGKLELTGEMMMAAPYGFAVPKDSQMGAALLAALAHLIQTGEYERILAQWGIHDGLLTEPHFNQKPINVKEVL